MELDRNKIKELADRQGMSMYKLMTKANISKSYFYRLVNGEMDNPSLNTLIKISEVLGCNISDILK